MNTSGHKVAKGFAYALAVFIILVIVGAATTLIIALSKGSELINIDGRNFDSVDFTKTFDGIDSLYIENGSADLDIIEGNVDKVTVNCTNVPEDFSVEATGGTLRIYSPKSDWFIISIGFDFSNMRIEVVIPRDYKLKKCEVDGGSGRSNIDISNADKLELKMGSGRSEINNVSAETFILEARSGSISGSNITAREMTADTGSGSVKLEKMNIGSLVLESGSGKVSYEGSVQGDININSGSGNVVMNIDAKKDNYSIDVESGSGGVWIDDKKMSDTRINNIAAEYDMRIDSGSGRVTIGFSNR